MIKKLIKCMSVSGHACVCDRVCAVRVYVCTWVVVRVCACLCVYACMCAEKNSKIIKRQQNTSFDEVFIHFRKTGLWFY